MSKSDIFLLRLKGKILLQSWVSLLTAFGHLNPQYLPHRKTNISGIITGKELINYFLCFLPHFLISFLSTSSTTTVATTAAMIAKTLICGWRVICLPRR
jgi:hypothetical protein